MNNSKERKLNITFDFLSEGKYKMVSDSEKTKENAEIADVKSHTVEKNGSIEITMVPGGGFAAWFEPVK